MKPPIFKPKNEKIKVFREEIIGDNTIKIYVHPEGTVLKAYVRQLSASEQNIGNAERDGNQVEFCVNPRAFQNDWFVEHKGNLYQISGIDNFMFQTDTDITFRGYSTNPRNDESYSEIKYTNWSG